MAFVACASAPEPTTTSKRKKRKKDDVELKAKKKKKKKKKKKRVDDDVVRIVDEGEEFEDAPTPDKPKDNEKDKEEPGPEPEPEPVADKPKKKKKKKDTDSGDDEEAADRPKKKKGKEEVDEPETEDVADKPKKKKDKDKDDGDDEELADRPKKKKRKDDGGDEEVADKPKKKKPAVVAAKAKANDDEAELDEADTADIEVEEPQPEPKSKRKKKAKRPDPEVADEGPVIDMEDEIEDEEPERRVAAIPVPGVSEDDPIAESDAEVSASVEAVKAAAGTGPINNRSLTLDSGKLDVHGGLRVGVITLPNAMGTPVSSSSQGLALGVTYGASDKAEVGADYTLSISPGSVKGPFLLRGAYHVTRGAKLDVAIAAGLAVDFFGFTDPTTMQTSSQTNLSLQLGAWARYRLTPKASLFTGLPAVPSSSVSLTKLSFPLPPYGYQLAIGLNNAGTKALEVPVGVGYQASPKLYAMGMLNLAHVRIADTANAFVFRDFFQLALGGFYTMKKIDVGAVLADDLKQGTDYLRFDIVVRYLLK